MMMRMTGARAVLECLKREGVDVVFGYPGGAILPLYEEMYKDNFRHILTGHEQGAVHAADGYARVTGRPGVCIATSGPGVCNMVTGIATANMDSIPMVIISGQVPTGLIGRDSFQEADISGITSPITKHNYLVKNAASIPRVLKEAFYIASTGRPGPVLIDIAKDALEAEIYFQYPDKVHLPGYVVETTGQAYDIDRAVAMIQHSQKPVFLVGGGVILSETRSISKTSSIRRRFPSSRHSWAKEPSPILTNSISVWAGCTALMHRTKPSQAAICSSP